MNTRLLNTAWDECGNSSCTPTSTLNEQELAQLGEQCEEEIDPNAGGFASIEDCEAARAAMRECRGKCLAAFACGSISEQDIGAKWQLLDPKRGAGGFDLLATHFEFPP